MATLQSMTITDTGNITLPVGTSANRPTVNSTSTSFTTVGSTSWTAPAGVTLIEVLVVGGGGGGGFQVGGGGGGGGVIYNSAYPVTPGNSYTVTVGAGGTGAANGSTAGTNGGLSRFDILVALGGGRGANHSTGATAGGLGASGSSGGGGSGNDGSVSALGGAGTTGQGFAGGKGRGPNGPNSGAAWAGGDSWAGGGGGGAGGAGADSTVNAQGGLGGVGLQFNISGTPTYYAGGGGGCNSVTGNPRVLGGLGGGGNGRGNADDAADKNGTANTGGGGGGVRDTSGAAGNGGSGIVIIRYSLTATSTVAIGQSRFNSTSGKIETFNTVNAFNIPRSPEHIVGNGLVLHLNGNSFYSGSATWQDSGPYGNNGTLTNGPVYNSSNGGNVTFDGSNDYVNISSFTGKPLNQITFESWIYPTRTPSTGTIRGGVISCTNSTYLGIFDSNDGGNTHGLHWANQTSASRTGSNNGSIPNEQWSHIVGTYDGVRCKGYVNGVLVYDVAQTGTITDGTYVVGTYGGGLTDGVHNFPGKIAVARIYNRSLSIDEIRQNLAAESGRFIKTPPMTTIGSGGIGSSPGTAATSARQIKEMTGTTTNGFYWIRPGNWDPLYLWCDMNYDGGGWALVLCNVRAGTFAGAPGTNGIGALTYQQCVNNNNINGTYTNRLQFRQFVGVKYWPALGLNAAQFCSTTTPTLSDTVNHTKRYRWRYTGFNDTFAFQGGAAVSDETGTGSPGFYSHNVAGGYNLTTTDRDQDTAGNNCASNYGGVPNWYSACWSGNPWGGGNAGGYADAPFWDSSGSDNHNYMAIYLKV